MGCAPCAEARLLPSSDSAWLSGEQRFKLYFQWITENMSMNPRILGTYPNLHQPAQKGNFFPICGVTRYGDLGTFLGLTS